MLFKEALVDIFFGGELLIRTRTCLFSIVVSTVQCVCVFSVEIICSRTVPMLFGGFTICLKCFNRFNCAARNHTEKHLTLKIKALLL